MKGWIALHRQLVDHWISDSLEDLGAWSYLLMIASHQETKFKLKGRLITLKRGQLARSKLSLAQHFKWSRTKLDRFLRLLKDDGMIELKSYNTTTVITICKYDSYQGVFLRGDTTDDTPDDTTKIKKNDENQKNKNIKKDNTIGTLSGSCEGSTTTDDTTTDTTTDTTGVHIQQCSNNVKQVVGSRKKRFTPPSLEEVEKYIQSKWPDIDVKFHAQDIWNFYEAKNWYSGKTKISQWKNSISRWVHKDLRDGKIKYPGNKNSNKTSGLPEIKIKPKKKEWNS